MKQMLVICWGDDDALEGAILTNEAKEKINNNPDSICDSSLWTKWNKNIFKDTSDRIKIRNIITQIEQEKN